MSRLRAAAGTLVFLAVAPGIIGGLAPWLLTGWRSAGSPTWLRIIGWVLLGSGAAVVLEAFARFVSEGTALRHRSPRPRSSSSEECIAT